MVWCGVGVGVVCGGGGGGVCGVGEEGEEVVGEEEEVIVVVVPTVKDTPCLSRVAPLVHFIR